MKVLKNLCRPNLPTKPDPTILNYTSNVGSDLKCIYVNIQEPSFEEEKISWIFICSKTYYYMRFMLLNGSFSPIPPTQHVKKNIQSTIVIVSKIYIKRATS